MGLGNLDWVIKRDYNLTLVWNLQKEKKNVICRPNLLLLSLPKREEFCRFDL